MLNSGCKHTRIYCFLVLSLGCWHFRLRLSSTKYTQHFVFRLLVLFSASGRRFCSHNLFASKLATNIYTPRRHFPTLPPFVVVTNSFCTFDIIIHHVIPTTTMIGAGFYALPGLRSDFWVSEHSIFPLVNTFLQVDDCGGSLYVSTGFSSKVQQAFPIASLLKTASFLGFLVP